MLILQIVLLIVKKYSIMKQQTVCRPVACRGMRQAVLHRDAQFQKEGLIFMNAMVLVAAGAVLALAFSATLFRRVKAQPVGTPQME